MHKNTWILICVAALGYFVDIYDLILYNIVKLDSLKAIGLDEFGIKQVEPILFNWQMFGMLCGGVFWGILGDKKGRISVLFGSILLYSIANIANAYVQNVPQYAFFRFLAGLGLAGELGAGITLVVESMDKEKRGWGTMIIVTFGALGAVVAAIIGKYFHWQTAYIIGGIMGLALLLLRASAFESGMYKNAALANIKRGNFLQLFENKHTFFKYLACIGVGLPIWFSIGVLINLSHWFLKDMHHNFGLPNKIVIQNAVMFAYIGLSVGDLISGILSQILKSRKKVIYIFLVLSIIVLLLYVNMQNISFFTFKLMCFLIGAATGFWALFVTNASEQFGTNVRSTVTNTVPNFVRGAAIPITTSFMILNEKIGILNAAIIVGLVCILISFISTYYLKETFNKELNYFE
jgi:putative MFS transporter